MENFYTKKCGPTTHGRLRIRQSAQGLLLAIVISLMLNLTGVYVLSTTCSAASASLLTADFYYNIFGPASGDDPDDYVRFQDVSRPATRLVGGS